MTEHCHVIFKTYCGEKGRSFCKNMPVKLKIVVLYLQLIESIYENDIFIE